MTSKKQEPRDFWKWEMRLEDMVNRNTRSINIYHRVMSPTEKIEVIEYSAYEQAQAEIKHLENERNAFLNEAMKYKSLFDRAISEFAEERRQLLACGGLTRHGEGQLAAWNAASKIMQRLAAYDAATKAENAT